MKPEVTEEAEHPVAYDAEGRPLYAHPAQPKQQVVHLARPTEPVKQVVSDEVKKRHKESVRLFPNLNLSEGEYVISAVRRHPIGLLIPMAIGVGLVLLTLSTLFNYGLFANFFGLTGAGADPAAATLPIVLLAVLFALVTYLAYYVYNSNKFFLTNESVIQEIQLTLLSHHEQTVSLANIEDASYDQKGIFAQLFDYGSIRLSTEGDETTYKFTFVANPKHHIAKLDNAVEAFKNGRPVQFED